MTDLYVEVEVMPSGELGGPPVLSKQDFAEHAGRVASSVGSVAREFTEGFDELRTADKAGWHVGEVEVTFGLSIEASGNILVAKGTAGANFSARIAWRQD